MDEIVAKCHRLHWAIGLILITAATTGCSPINNKETIQSAENPTIVLPARRAGHEAILVFMPIKAETIDVLESLRDELIDDFDIVLHAVTDETTATDIGKQIYQHQPACLLLMNNRTVKHYYDFQQSQPPDTAFPPAVVVMTSYLSGIYKKLKNTTGIAYEVPEVTIFMNLRKFLDHPIERIGVLYRPPFEDYLKEQIRFAEMEKFETIKFDVGMEPSPRDIRRAIRYLRNSAQVDAIWVLNDNGLLTGRGLIAEGWLRELRRNPLPVAVGVEHLVHKDVQFGSFAMIPDHSALGVQTANLIFDLADSDWHIETQQIEQPLSVKKIVDIKQTRTHLRFKKELISQIDIVIQ